MFGYPHSKFLKEPYGIHRAGQHGILRQADGGIQMSRQASKPV
jgi:hypothetical protein